VEARSSDTASLSDLDTSALGAMPSRGVVALRTALQALLRSGAPDDDVRRAMSLFCAEARRRELPAERVLVLLKEAWRSLPEVRRLRRTQREHALAHLTTLAIRTFYEPSADAPESPADAPAPR
jgi:hypothetical protein